MISKFRIGAFLAGLAGFALYASPAQAVERLVDLSDRRADNSKLPVSSTCQQSPDVARLVAGSTTYYNEFSGDTAAGTRTLTGEEALKVLKIFRASDFQYLCVLEAEPATVATLLEKLQSGEADYAIGMLTQTFERVEAGINFTHPYFRNSEVLIRKDMPQWQKDFNIFLLQIAISATLIVMFGGVILLFCGNQVKMRCEEDDTIQSSFASRVQYALETTQHVLSTIGFGNRYLTGFAGGVVIFFIYQAGSYVNAWISAKIIDGSLSSVELASPSEMEGMTIAVPGGAIPENNTSVHRTYAELHDAEIVFVDKTTDGIELLENDEVDGVLTDLAIGRKIVERNRGLKIAIQFADSDIGMAAANASLADALKQAVLYQQYASELE